MGSWATQVGENSTFGPGDWIQWPAGFNPPGSGPMDGTLRNIQLRMFDDDGNKISYYTPRFEGFQVGISYTPNSAQNTQTGTSAAEARAKKSVYHDYWSFGGNFDRKFGDVGVGVAAGYVMAKSPGTGAADTATTWANKEDAKTWGIGASVEWGPFKISGGYRENIDVRDTNGVDTTVAGSGGGSTTSMDGTLYDIGGRYTFGPNAVSLTYRSGTSDGTKVNTTEDEEEMVMLSYRRTLGPGVNWDANLFYLKATNEGGTEIAGTLNPQENSGWAFTTAIQLAF
jgi:predicted porin